MTFIIAIYLSQKNSIFFCTFAKNKVKFIINYIKEVVKMATKSFTIEMFFDKKYVNGLIKVLNNKKSPNRKPVKNVEIIRDSETIQKIFGKN